MKLLTILVYNIHCSLVSHPIPQSKLYTHSITSHFCSTTYVIQLERATTTEWDCTVPVQGCIILTLLTQK
jgi:hypothetical protein